jgi:hypothetical protein
MTLSEFGMMGPLEPLMAFDWEDFRAYMYVFLLILVVLITTLMRWPGFFYFFIYV